MLETPRLILRGHRAADLEAALALWQHPDVYRFITGQALNRSDVWLRLLRYSGLWDFLGYGYWAVQERASGRYIGQLGFADFKRGLVGFDGRYPEAGWVIHPDHGGRGYAGEGMAAACAWLDAGGEHARSYCLIDARNERSVRLASRLGYRYALQVTLGSDTVDVHTRDSH